MTWIKRLKRLRNPEVIEAPEENPEEILKNKGFSEDPAKQIAK